MAKTKHSKIKEGLVSILLFLSAMVIVISTVVYLNLKQAISSQASTLVSLNLDGLTEESELVVNNNTSFFSLYNAKTALYNIPKGKSIAEYLINNPSLPNEGRFSSKFDPGILINNKGKLLPSNFLKNSRLTKSLTDEQGKEHYSYSQYIEGHHDLGPVFGSSLKVHLDPYNKKGIYAMSGKLTNNKEVQPVKLTPKQAEEVAMVKAIKDTNNRIILKLDSSEPYVVNNSLFSINDDDTDVNYPSLAVSVMENSQFPVFHTKYFVNLTTGRIILEEKKVNQIDTGNRYIWEYTKIKNDKDKPYCKEYEDRIECYSKCKNFSKNYSCWDEFCCMDGNLKITTPEIVRSEGNKPINDPEADDAYDYIGTVADIYKDKFNWFGVDNKASDINALVNIIGFSRPSSDEDKVLDCPNAAWSYSNNTIMLCKDMAKPDVVGHEYAHAVEDNTSSIIPLIQPGSVAESIADIFATMVDNNEATKWLIAEAGPEGVLRNLAEPPKTPVRNCIATESGEEFCNAPMPDRLFSPYFDCIYDAEHKNSTVASKALYLMYEGGEFNGCKVTGIEDKTYQILFKAMHDYFDSAENFRDLYIHMLYACRDFYNDDICNQVQKAMQATEIDQQLPDRYIGTKCIKDRHGRPFQRRIPACAK